MLVNCAYLDAQAFLYFVFLFSNNLQMKTHEVRRLSFYVTSLIRRVICLYISY